MSCRSLDTAFCRISPHLPEGVPSSLGWWVKACGGKPTLSRPLSSISQQGSNFLMIFRTAWGLHLTSSHLSPELILSFLSPSFPFATLCTVFAPGLLGVPFFILCDPIASSIFYSAWSPQQLWHCILFIYFLFLYSYSGSLCALHECCECACVWCDFHVCGGVYTPVYI